MKKCNTCGLKFSHDSFSTVLGGLKDNCKLCDKWMTYRRNCYDKKSQLYPRFGAIGVVLCDEWENNATAFAEWMLAAEWKPGARIYFRVEKKVIGPDSITVHPLKNGKKQKKRKTACNVNPNDVINRAANVIEQAANTKIKIFLASVIDLIEQEIEKLS